MRVISSDRRTRAAFTRFRTSRPDEVLGKDSPERRTHDLPGGVDYLVFASEPLEELRRRFTGRAIPPGLSPRRRRAAATARSARPGCSSRRDRHGKEEGGSRRPERPRE
jgi:hypothetical protein